MVLATTPPFSKSGPQVIAGEYLDGPLLKWDQIFLFDQLFAAGSMPEMSIPTWELTELLCSMVIVVGPSSPPLKHISSVSSSLTSLRGSACTGVGIPHPNKFPS
ncbi:hypothetical protein PDIG_27930 [Penicillium digitatum PHI26]|uniref:Uncharacterized protein n=2 Tax=Penicillium digitatum TaxID=36651 RepID=K9G2J3_PEND2|nr:hypothetical protein PDIP_62370 [Penicillium digitatum Pd1]EKV09905.1 hypothetical protein PDIP_62370 [Penicillium digitatum Pd1]EKV15112.1 hypothetical protein PDIG_27930 [Penicillium digitatum PHI26]